MPHLELPEVAWLSQLQLHLWKLGHSGSLPLWGVQPDKPQKTGLPSSCASAFCPFCEGFCYFFGAGGSKSHLALSFNIRRYCLSAAAGLGIIGREVLRPLQKGRNPALKSFTFIFNFACYSSADFASSAHRQLLQKPHFPFCSILRFARWMGE